MRIVRLCLGVLLCLISVASVAGAPRQAPVAATACPNGTCTVYLPLQTYQVAPVLLAPVEAEQISSLAPNLSWRPIVAGLYKIQASTDAAFSPTVTLTVSTTKQIKLPLPAQVDTQLTSNLKPATTYYWRVSVTLPEGEVFAPTQIFITPAQEAVQLPGLVPIIAPRNNTVQKGPRILLKWGAIPGAVLYRIRMFDASGNPYNPGTVQIDGTETAVWIEGIPKGKYTWKIKVYTAAGWGPYDDDYTFTIT